MAEPNISKVVSDILKIETNNVKNKNVQIAYQKIVKAKAEVYEVYRQLINQQTVLNKIMQNQNYKNNLRQIDAKAIEAYNQAKIAQAQALHTYKANIISPNLELQNIAKEKWDIYRRIKMEYSLQQSQKIKILPSLIQDNSFNEINLKQALINAIFAIEFARDVFQKPVKYSIGFYIEGESRIREGIFSLSDLYNMGALTITELDSGNIYNTVAISLNITQEMLSKVQNLKYISKKDSAIILDKTGSNRGWKYQWYKEEQVQGSSERKQDNKVWSAGPDIESKKYGRYGLQAKFMSFQKGSQSSSLQISSLNSILASLETYEAKLNALLNNKELDTTKMGIKNMSNEFKQKIIYNLQKQI